MKMCDEEQVLIVTIQIFQIFSKHEPCEHLAKALLKSCRKFKLY